MNEHLPSIPARMGANPLLPATFRTLASAKESNGPHGWPVAGCVPGWTVYDDMRPAHARRWVYHCGRRVADIEARSAYEAQRLAETFVRAQVMASVLCCLLSYESETAERTDLQRDNDSLPGRDDVLVPLHVFEQAKNALGGSR